MHATANPGSRRAITAVRIAVDDPRRLSTGQAAFPVTALPRRERPHRSCVRLARFADARAASRQTPARRSRAAGLAPIPVSSGRTNHHRLDRGGNRQINAAIHRIAVTRGRVHPETIDYLERKRAEGKTKREATRSLKRHLAHRIWHLLQPPHPIEDTAPPSIS